MNCAEQLNSLVRKRWGKASAACDAHQLYTVLLDFCKAAMGRQTHNSGKKKLYYLSMEFLVGRLLAGNLLNLGLYDDVDAWLRENGSSLADIEASEPEPSLGNGGLGRLAACYLDSCATLGLPADGICLCYHFGLFRQAFEDHKQHALRNPWIESDSWLEDTGRRYAVQFADTQVEAALYDVDVPGYQNGSGRLHLFDLATTDESLVEKDGIGFDKTAITKNLTLFLYPDDSGRDGRLLRVYQEYFMASCAAQLILEEAEARGSNLHDLADYAVVQINDTHPSMVIPELIRLLMQRGLEIDEAIAIVESLCAFTNHTILAEALEKWPMEYIGEVAPQIVPVLWELDLRAKEKYPAPPLAIIDEDNRVHMAHIDIHYGFSVNGVAALHTGILEKSELADFYKIYPEKFGNKTNGVTFRRWLLACNRPLAALIEELIGPGFKTDATQLEKLLDYKKDAAVLRRLDAIKQENKQRLAAFLQENTGVAVDPGAVFDIQVKRLHEYKRQQLNLLWVIRQYLAIKAGRLPKRSIAVVLGGKAAPAYVTAQDIIHLALCLQQLIDSDAAVRPHLQLAMIENYNVSAAELAIPACDISEQISLASKEASGTGNMKFMLNGAVTLGTMDGANVEIAQLVGRENIYIFGESSDKVIARYKAEDYDPLPYYAIDDIGRLVDFIVSRELIAIGDRACLARLHRELIAKDWFMTLPDAQSYFAARDRMLADYEDRPAWAAKMLVNIAKAGFFSSDRAVAEYDRDIWRLSGQNSP
ncbi:MAG: glycogen/starch/alpha-glucan phosphorylase [Ruminococcaceae bacterium]|nr:glycogen/starch/alpha-glucan phosphorylase [Oscillospiraceae bacterium]